MCLGVPGKVVQIDDQIALVDFWGVRKEVRLDVVDEPVSVGDYVLNHVGYAIRRIPAEQVEATLSLYEELLASEDFGAERRSPRDGELEGLSPSNEKDLMRADVLAEIAGAETKR